MAIGVERLDVIGRFDAMIGPIKQRRRGHTGGQLLAAAQLAGEDFLVGLDRQRADTTGQQLAPASGLCATTAAGLARRFTDGQWRAVETGLGDVHAAGLAALAAVAPQRATALAQSVTIWTPPMWRSTGAASAGWRSTIRAGGSGVRTWPPGPTGAHALVTAGTGLDEFSNLKLGREDPRLPE
jgi:hypothetical protein